MPYSLILNLIPLSSISPQYVSGRHLHALFLTLVSTIDRDLGDRLHHSESDKAFTLSPLQTKKSVSQLQWEHHRWRMVFVGDFLDNEYTIEGTSLHDRVHNLSEEMRADIHQVRAIWLKSEKYQLIGKADLIESISGEIYPVEYKRGKRGEGVVILGRATISPMVVNEGIETVTLILKILILIQSFNKPSPFRGIETSLDRSSDFKL